MYKLHVKDISTAIYFRKMLLANIRKIKCMQIKDSSQYLKFWRKIIEYFLFCGLFDIQINSCLIIKRVITKVHCNKKGDMKCSVILIYPTFCTKSEGKCAKLNKIDISRMAQHEILKFTGNFSLKIRHSNVDIHGQMLGLWWRVIANLSFKMFHFYLFWKCVCVVCLVQSEAGIFSVRVVICDECLLVLPRKGHQSVYVLPR